MRSSFIATGLMTVLSSTLAQATTPPPAVDKRVLIGLVSEQGTGKCVSGHQTEWTDLHYEIGWAITDGAAVKPLVGSLVAAVGVVKEKSRDLSAITGNSPCGMEQMRSDWVLAKSGIRVVRGPRPAGRFAVEKVVPFTGLKVTAGKDGILTAAFTHDLAAIAPEVGRLEKVGLVVYYEGTRGKPGTVAQRFELGDIEPGKSASVAFPSALYPASPPVKGEAREPDYEAGSVAIEAEGKVLFDLEVPIRKLLK